MTSRSYNGGKNGSGVYQAIINEIPPHRFYYEMFLGSGAIMRNKRPAIASIGIDKDTAVMALWTGNEIPDLTLIVADAISFLRTTTFNTQDFVYCDPPYLMSVRANKRPLYRCELDEADHYNLLAILKTLPCMVAISGYHNSIYAGALSSWRTIEINTVKRNGKPAVEVLWMNYPKPTQLHDYRYLGRDYRERENIRQKIKRQVSRLRELPDLEREAIIEACIGSRTTAGNGVAGDTVRNDVRRQHHFYREDPT